MTDSPPVTRYEAQKIDDKIHRSHLQAIFGRPFQTSGVPIDPLIKEAPASAVEKFKLPPRRRKALDSVQPKPYDRGMEFTTESTDYNVAEFYEQFHNNLPKVVKVTQGFYGEIVEDTFDRDQVMRLQTVSRQRRVVARMTIGNYTKLISIPVVYNEKLCIVKPSGKHGKEKDISTILKENTLPLTVQFPKDRHITVGNQTVSTNHIPHMELLKTFEEMYLLGNFITDGVMSQEVVHVPLYLSRMRMAVVTGIIGQPKEKWTGYQEELSRASSYIVYDQEFGNPNIAEYDPSAIHSDTTYSYVEPRMYSNIVTLVQKSPTKSFDNQMYYPEQLHHQKGGEVPGVYEEIDNTARNGTPKITTFKPNTSDTQHVINKELAAVIETKRKMSDPSVITMIQKPGPSQVQHAHLTSVAPIVAPKPTVIGPGGVPVLPERKQIPNVPPSSKKPNPFAVYSNDVPRGQINPTKNQEGHENTPSRQSNVLHVERKVLEVNGPEDVATLSIDDVGDYLKKLNLDQYVDSFKAEMIDGTMLQELDKDMLKDDFGMKMIEALRLTKFASTGHVPS